VLRGGGPDDVRELTLGLARVMLELVGIDTDPQLKLDDGSAYEVYRSMIAAQGGDPDAVLAPAALHDVVSADASGYVTAVDALRVGVAGWRLGAGRARKEDPVSAGAGVLCLVREGDHIAAGEPLFELYADDDEHLVRGRDAIRDAVTISDDQSARAPILLEKITK
jgi:thymidine phosphorylase